MIRRLAQTPARRYGRAGVLLFVTLCVACQRGPDPDEGPRTLELAHDTIKLPSGTRLVDVKVRRDTSGDFHPAVVQAKQNDVIRFVAEDRGGHAIAFDAAGPALEYLQRTGQQRSPPLITKEAAWVITLDGAPAGEYPFRCTTHDIAGRLTVAPR